MQRFCPDALREVRGQRSEVRGQPKVSSGLRKELSALMGSGPFRRRDDSGGHVRELFGGRRQHRVQRSGQLPAFVGQMVSVRVGELADQAVVTQEAKMPGLLMA